MQGALYEKALTALSVCILTGTISVVGGRVPPTAETVNSHSVTRVIAVAVAVIEAVLVDSRAMLAGYVNGNPYLLGYSLASVALMLLMLRS